jgi:hypothetical protein
LEGVSLNINSLWIPLRSILHSQNVQSLKTMKNRHLYILSAALGMLGILLFFYKAFYLGFPIRPGEQTNFWEIEIRINFSATERPVKALLYVPSTTKNFSILNENFISRGYGISISKSEGNRQVVWTKRNAKGQQTLYYRAMIEKTDAGEIQLSLKNIEVEPYKYEGADREAAVSILQEAKQKSADILTLVSQLVEKMEDYENDDNVNLLMKGKFTLERKIESIIRILSLEYIPARMVHGLKLDEQYGEAAPIPWFEVFTGDHWQAIDPVTGLWDLLEDYLVLWRGEYKLVHLVGGENLDVDINVKQTELESISAAHAREKIISPDYWKYSVSNLPLATQKVYSILLLVPLGVFVLVIMRNVIGIRTFGTFMPVLIALSFRETQLLAGLILFMILVTLGLVIRFYLERLKLLLVPRLASVLIIVILLMLLVSIISHNLGFESGLSVALFPMVIMTMTIERMSIVWEERGAMEAIYQGIGSLFTASIAFLIMSISLLEHFVTVFPELIFVLLAVTMLFGRYSGYRLLELFRFKTLVDK